MAEQPSYTVYNKIGLHIGPYTNPELLQIWLNEVDQANIPMFLTVASDFHFLFNLVGRLRFPANHTIVFQFHPQQLAETIGSQFDFTNPDFYRQNQSPEQISRLADEYWQHIQRLLPSDFPRDRAWLELVSGLSTVSDPGWIEGQADWLGEFSWALTRRTTAEGTKVALFGWPSGEPDPAAWRTNGMLRLLDFSQKYPDQIAIALKEFSGRLDTISSDAPESGIGRFRSLVQVCEEEGIMPPPILITEWGWTRERIPNPRTALNHIIQVNEELYAHYTAVRGAALWSLDPDAGPIADQAADLVERLAEMTATRQFTMQETDPYATEDTFNTDPYTTYGEESGFDQVKEALPGEGTDSYQYTEQRIAQQTPLVKGASNIDIPTNLESLITQSVTPAAETPPSPSRPPHAWLGIIPENEVHEGLASINPIPWRVVEGMQAGDLLVLFQNGAHHQITHLATVQEPPKQQVQEDPGQELVWTAVLGNLVTLQNPLTAKTVSRHPQLTNWQFPAEPFSDLTEAGQWSVLRDLLLAWNPEQVARLAEWEGVTEADLLGTAVATAQQLPEGNGRTAALITLIERTSGSRARPALLDTLQQDRAWRVRRAARQAAGIPPTPDILLADATDTLRQQRYQDVLEILHKVDTSWESSGTDQQRATGYSLLAQAYEGLDDHPHALTNWRKAAPLNPDDSAPFAGIARNTPDNQLEKSAEFIQKIANSAPESAGPTVGLASIAERRNQYAEAAQLLGVAIQRAATDLDRQRIESRREVIIQYLPTPPATAVPDLTQLDPREKKLVDFIRRHFSRDELRSLCTDLQVNYEELSEGGISRMATELVRGISAASRLRDLENLVKQHRPEQAYVFQDSVPELIENAQSLLPHDPDQAIRYLQEQKEEWENGSGPERATIHTILAQAHAATGNQRMAYINWERCASLQPSADNAFIGMAQAAHQVGPDLLDKAEAKMQEMRQHHPGATGPTLGLATIAQLRNEPLAAADLLAETPAASLVRQRQMAQAARKLVADADAPAQSGGQTPAPLDLTQFLQAEKAPLADNPLNRTLADLAAAPADLNDNEQVAILRDFVRQTLTLPTLNAAHKEDLRRRSAQVLAEVERMQRVTPEMMAELQLPILDALFITQPAQRRALIRAASQYRQSSGRRLALFLRREARRRIRQQLDAERVANMTASKTKETARKAGYEMVKTAVFTTGSFHMANQPLQTLADLCRANADHPVRPWRLAANEQALHLTGNLNHTVRALELARYDGRERDFWQLLQALVHNQDSQAMHLDSWGRFRRSPLPDSMSSILLAAFYPEIHLPYEKRQATQLLEHLGLGDKANQLDYRAYMALAHNLLGDPDLGFDDLDDVGLFLFQVAQGCLPITPDPSADQQAPLHSPLARRVKLLPAFIDTALVLPADTFNQICSALNAGNHIILIGPPGTGKTTIAQDVSHLAHDTNASRGFISVTATADWTTFDTIGGYMPTADGRLAFSEGIVLRAIREEKWLIIDEINRAEIDKAFGEMFTVLSGQPVTLPYRDGHHPIRILPPGYPRQSEKDYVLPATWRIIGTMNVYDKASLFEMSYAFMRRFAFVDVGIPDQVTFTGLINLFLRQVGLPDDSANQVAELLCSQLFKQDEVIMRHRPLGPAIARDMTRYLAQRQAPESQVGLDHVAEAFLLYAVPQFDGLEERKIVEVTEALHKMFAAQAQAIHHRLQELFPQYSLPELVAETAVAPPTATTSPPTT